MTIPKAPDGRRQRKIFLTHQAKLEKIPGIDSKFVNQFVDTALNRLPWDEWENYEVSQFVDFATFTFIRGSVYLRVAKLHWPKDRIGFIGAIHDEWLKTDEYLQIDPWAIIVGDWSEIFGHPLRNIAMGLFESQSDELLKDFGGIIPKEYYEQFPPESILD